MSMNFFTWPIGGWRWMGAYQDLGGKLSKIVIQKIGNVGKQIFKRKFLKWCFQKCWVWFLEQLFDLGWKNRKFSAQMRWTGLLLLEAPSVHSYWRIHGKLTISWTVTVKSYYSNFRWDVSACTRSSQNRRIKFVNASLLA